MAEPMPPGENRRADPKLDSKTDDVEFYRGFGGAGEIRTRYLLTERSMILSGECSQREDGQVPG